MDSGDKCLLGLVFLFVCLLMSVLLFAYKSNNATKDLKKVCIESMKTQIPADMPMEIRASLTEHYLYICLGKTKKYEEY